MGTTAEKLTYLNTTKGKIKDSINLTGANITTEPFRQYSTKLNSALLDIINNGTQEVWDNWEKVSASNVSSASLNQTVEAPMKLDLKGNTYQSNETGNLFDKNNANILNAYLTGDTITANSQTRTLYISCIPNTTYTVSKIQSSRFAVAYTTNTPSTSETTRGKLQENSATSITITTDSTANYLCVFYYHSTYDTSITEQQILNSIVIKATTNVPSPTYPQDIHIVSGNNSIKIEGKNLFNATIRSGKVTDSGYASDGTRICTNEFIKVKPNTTYTLSFDTTNSISKINVSYFKTNQFPRNSETNWITNFTITTPNDINYILITFAKSNDGAVSTTDILNIQLELGTQTTYTPYVSQTYPINLPEGMYLGWIGDYQDRIFKAIEGDNFYDTLDSATKQTLDTGSWYKYGAIGKVVLDGSESWGIASTSAMTGTKRFYYNNSNVYNSKINLDTNVYVKSNYFKGLSWREIYTTDTTTKNAISNYNDSQTTTGRISIRIDENFASNTTAFQTWLSTHNTTVYYVLSTPTYTKITDNTLISQLEAIKKSYNEQTNISQTPNDLPFILDITALENM